MASGRKAKAKDQETEAFVNEPDARDLPPKTPQKVEKRSASKKVEGHGEFEHSMGGTTTRDDATDLGVPMLPGSPDEPQGPEDALGPGPKRGDYSNRIGGSDYNPHQVVPNPDAEEGEPQVKVVSQRERASDQGEVPAKKGGVDTEAEAEEA
jgi:hypothetical protein